jgi:hypothetical protein
MSDQGFLRLLCIEILVIKQYLSGNNPMVGMTVAVAVAVSQALAK